MLSIFNTLPTSSDKLTVKVGYYTIRDDVESYKEFTSETVKLLHGNNTIALPSTMARFSHVTVYLIRSDKAYRYEWDICNIGDELILTIDDGTSDPILRLNEKSVSRRDDLNMCGPCVCYFCCMCCPMEALDDIEDAENDAETSCSIM